MPSNRFDPTATEREQAGSTKPIIEICRVKFGDGTAQVVEHPDAPHDAWGVYQRMPDGRAMWLADCGTRQHAIAYALKRIDAYLETNKGEVDPCFTLLI